MRKAIKALSKTLKEQAAEVVHKVSSAPKVIHVVVHKVPSKTQVIHVVVHKAPRTLRRTVYTIVQR